MSGGRPDFFHDAPTVVREVDLGLGPRGRLRLRAPADMERLLDAIDAATFREDERMPYWAELWPAARAFATWLLAGPGGAPAAAAKAAGPSDETLLSHLTPARARADPRCDKNVSSGPPKLVGRAVLELGSGLGLCGIAAARAGAGHVTFSDYFPESLAFSAENALLNGVPRDRFATLHLDWRRPELPARFAVVLGSDLLYEARNLEPVLGAIDAALEPAGRAFVADPDRITADRFAERATARGFTVARRLIGKGVSVYELWR